MNDPIYDGLHLGDCFEVMARIPDGSVDMVLADLPYSTTQNKWDNVIDLPALWAEYHRLLKPTGAAVLTSQGAFTARLILSNEGWFRYKLVWEKSKATNFLNAKKQPLRKHEDVCVFYPGKPTYNPQMGKGVPYDKGVRKNQQTGSYGNFAASHVKSEGGRYPTDVIYFKTAESESEFIFHPTQKPVALFEYLIRTYTDEGMTVLDNTAGSGTTAIAAMNAKRNWICIERDPEYYAKAKARIEDHINKMELF